MIQKKNGFDWWLSGICLARAFNGLVFMTYAATLPVVQQAWGMSASSAGTIAGAISPLLFGVILDGTNPAGVSERGYAIWGWAYGALGIGGLVALVAAWRTGRMRKSRVDR